MTETINGDVFKYYESMADMLRQLKEKWMEDYVPPTEEEILQEHMNKLSAATPIIPGNDIESIWR